MNLIELKNVDVFQTNRLILSDVSFNIKPTEFVYLIGATGSDKKSSLLKTLYAELPVKKLWKVVDYQLFDIKKILDSFFKKKNWYCLSRFSTSNRPYSKR